MAVPDVANRRDVEQVLEEVHRREWGVLLAATAMVARDFDLAEECVQEAYTDALRDWQRDGIPANPAGWLTTVARRRSFDAVRRRDTLRRKLPLLVTGDGEDLVIGPGQSDEGGIVTDERLRLIFTCCHPAIAKDAQLALTLRLVCGIPTPDIAHVLLTTPSAMSARLTRAKHKIALARIPVKVPGAAELPERLDAVLMVVYLLCTLGHVAPSGESLSRIDVVDESVRLARVLFQLMPDEPEVRGLVGLVLVEQARHSTRTDEHGRLLRLEDQNRAKWNRATIAEASELLGRRAPGAPGRFELQARIALEHARSSSFSATDWATILRLYDQLYAQWPTPVVKLNRTVARSMAEGPDAALDDVLDIERDGHLSGYHYLYAVKAELLVRLGRIDEADEATKRAISLAGNAIEREYLEGELSRRSRVPDSDNERV